MKNILLVFLGGGAGSVARYAISYFVFDRYKPTFPFATLASNIISCIIMGIAAGYFLYKADNVPMRMLVLTGFCGGFSTFSTFSFETVELVRNGYTMYALINVALSIIVCFLLIQFLAKSNVV